MNNKEKLDYFYSLPKYEQKSEKWLNQRYDHITGSNISSALASKESQNRRNLLRSKVLRKPFNNFEGNVYTHWGNKYEPVANSLYLTKVPDIIIHEYGLITNPNYFFLGVSPDGIIEYLNDNSKGKMLEIKCPYSRVINGKIKNDYYDQMQEQMLVCDYNTCDFLECTFSELSENEFYNFSQKCINSINDVDKLEYNKIKKNNKEHGVIIAYLEKNKKEEKEENKKEEKENKEEEKENKEEEKENKEENKYTVKYLYSPIYYNNSIEEIKQWINDNITKYDNDNIYLYTTYWKLDVYLVQEVQRDNIWFNQNFPILEEFWEDVCYYREHLDELPKSNSSSTNNSDIEYDLSSMVSKVCLI